MTASPLAFLLSRFVERPDHVAIIRDQDRCSYGSLLDLIATWRDRLAASGIANGNVVLLKGEFEPHSVACLLALIDLCAIVVPITSSSMDKVGEFAETSEAEFIVDLIDKGDITATERGARHPHYNRLRESGSPGLVLFSSGTTGKSKGIVHDVNRLLSKFHSRRKDYRTLAFLLFDHIGGLDTLFYCLSNSSSLVFADKRDPVSICQLIEAHCVEVLPTAPSFLNLLLISGVYRRYDLSSLRVITYGAEVMLQSTLEQCATVFPGVTLLQKYGTSEIGSLRSSSRDNRSRWVKIGGEGYRWRERDGKLEIKTDMAMIGYLNAPEPFTEDGYFITGDCIETDGHYIRFSGRDSDVINVGGRKVFPAEIENLIKEIPEVAEVVVFGTPSPLIGNIVCCKVAPIEMSTSAAELRSKIRTFLKGRLDPHKIPQKITVAHESLTTKRLKKARPLP